MKKEKIVVCWSGGKDSSLMLDEILSSRRYEVRALLTTMTEGYDRISMHGVRRELLEEQARSLNLDLEMIWITQKASNKEYEAKMAKALTKFKGEGIHTVAFGDIFLEDLRKYREEVLAKLGMKGHFPIWKKNTRKLMESFIQKGFKGALSCVDTKVLDPAFAGRFIDEDLIKDLPKEVDPCGENGEFHSFVFDGPIFRNEVQLTVGERIQRGQFCFCDLVPKIVQRTACSDQR